MFYSAAGVEALVDGGVAEAVGFIVVALVADAVEDFIDGGGVDGVDFHCAGVGHVGQSAVEHQVHIQGKHFVEVRADDVDEGVDEVVAGSLPQVA